MSETTFEQSVLMRLERIALATETTARLVREDLEFRQKIMLEQQEREKQILAQILPTTGISPGPGIQVLDTRVKRREPRRTNTAEGQ